MAIAEHPDFESRIAALEAKVASLSEELEHSKTLARINHALNEADQGLGVPLRQVDNQLLRQI